MRPDRSGRARSKEEELTLKSETLSLPSGLEQIVFRGGDGPPLLWLHGLSGVEPDHPLLASLLEHHSVIAPVAPGFNDLSELDEMRDVHDLALRYDDILDAVAVDEVAVVGHSFGAMIGAEYAAHYPRRVSRLALLSPIGLWNPEYPVADLFALPYHAMPTLLYATNPSEHSAITRRSRTDDYIEALNTEREEAEVEALVDLARGMTTVAKFLWPLPDRGLARRLYRISAPTIVVFGELDAFTPARYADDFVRAIADARSSIVPDAGHMAPVECPERVAEIVLGFLGAQRAPA
jgi:pimeloyl-ACP methyl ester carboxylesterase